MVVVELLGQRMHKSSADTPNVNGFGAGTAVVSLSAPPQLSRGPGWTRCSGLLHVSLKPPLYTNCLDLWRPRHKVSQGADAIGVVPTAWWRMEMRDIALLSRQSLQPLRRSRITPQDRAGQQRESVGVVAINTIQFRHRAGRRTGG
jgi:hypothetical protein